MWLFRFLKIDVQRCFPITPSIVFLLIVLQLAAWYPFLNNAYQEVTYQNRLKNRAIKNWQKALYQAQKLESSSFITDEWVSHQVIASKEGVPRQWGVEGGASLVRWQTLLEYVEEQVALKLSSVVWQNRFDGNWFGHLSFDVLAPRKGIASHYWLPIQSHTGRFAEREWKLLSILHTDNQASALLQYKQAKRWVSEGDWLPQAAMTVDQVLYDRITLITKDGKKEVLSTMQAENIEKAN
ncbi:hypothetical protein [Marinomonas transparens]|uniref:Uncharacterized protein n=1 Tax=Marinomonas transparens TaxID=2795388 RepID=A0A934JL01_9GAMM|nr:hypothetical protein [Marinomonas transparens]MBJ7538080.1 hypothetical protein [Marinomonas transparens]